MFQSGVDGHVYAVDTPGAAAGTPVPFFTAGTGTWSPDSRWLVMGGVRPEVPHVFALVAYDTAQGVPGPAVELAVPGSGSVTTTWRGDSKQAVFTVAQPPTSYLVNVSDTAFATPAMLTFPQSPLRVSLPTNPWSDDGRWLVYTGVVVGQTAPVYSGLVDTTSDAPMVTDLVHLAPRFDNPWAPGTELLALQATTGSANLGRLQVLDAGTPGAAPITVDGGHDATIWAWEP